MTKIILKKNEEKRIKQGHLWVFSNEIERRMHLINVDLPKSIDDESKVQNGEIVEVYDYKNNFLGLGFFNSNSLISIRMITNQRYINLKELLEERLLAAYAFRKLAYPERNSFRMVFSESDFIPGLIIDKYNNTFVLQIYSAGIQKNIDIIIDILKNRFNAENIFTKNEPYFRKLEGLPEEDQIFLGNRAEEIININGVKFKIDFENAHKTGFYFDQCDNRIFTASFCKDKDVLDCFCNSGGFGLHAIKEGAKSVVFVDSSIHEIKSVEANYKLNNFNAQIELVCEDVFNFLEKTVLNGNKFDVVILDPPAFAKKKKSLPQAIKGYEKLNKLAMQVVKNGGLLFTSSCSFHLKKENFLLAVNNASLKAKKHVQMFYFNNASKDHLALPSMEETVYLKFASFVVSS
ncbi:class I SAM-dependent rRNA methyltransferase [Melioribacteraceae bacterium 4301-Me]|uniref:class I SAM-dependent rRNA methyltransferase n=1 Tax=Pyranulibacter aquaticus TaxID=3163344 RepID=UPI003598473D